MDFVRNVLVGALVVTSVALGDLAFRAQQRVNALEAHIHELSNEGFIGPGALSASLRPEDGSQVLNVEVTVGSTHYKFCGRSPIEVSYVMSAGLEERMRSDVMAYAQPAVSWTPCPPTKGPAPVLYGNRQP